MKEKIDLDNMTIKKDENMRWPEAVRDIVFLICLLVFLIVFCK